MGFSLLVERARNSAFIILFSAVEKKRRNVTMTLSVGRTVAETYMFSRKVRTPKDTTTG